MVARIYQCPPRPQVLLTDLAIWMPPGAERQGVASLSSTGVVSAWFWVSAGTSPFPTALFTSVAAGSPAERLGFQWERKRGRRKVASLLLSQKGGPQGTPFK